LKKKQSEEPFCPHAFFEKGTGKKKKKNNKKKNKAKCFPLSSPSLASDLLLQLDRARDLSCPVLSPSFLSD
jgi:hypothetical protein